MAAKRQRKGKSPWKGNKGKILWPGVGTSGEHPLRRWWKSSSMKLFQDLACLGHYKRTIEHPLPDWWCVLALICIGQAQGEETKSVKGGSQDRLKPLLQGQPAKMPCGCTILHLPSEILGYKKETWIDIFSKEDIQMANRHMKKKSLNC